LPTVVIRGAFDDRVACFEHCFKAHRAIGSNGVTQQVFRQNNFNAGGLAVIPFALVMRSVRTNHPMTGSNFVPALRFARARPSDTVQVHGQPIGVQ
jgi:hypothetical protein